MKYYKEKKYKELIKGQDIAQELTRLSGEINDRKIKVGSTEIELSKEISLKKSIKIKDGEFFLEISIKAKIVNDILTKEKDRPEKAVIKDKKRRPYEAKKIKKAMGAYWKDLVKSYKKRANFTEKEALLGLLEQYGQMTEEDWHQLWVECAQNVKNIIELMEQGEFGGLDKKIEEVNQQIKSCHKLYK